MNRSVRIKQKVNDLIELAEELTVTNGQMSDWCYDLLDLADESANFIPDACCLNNDGTPLQLSLTSGQKGIALRVISDPGAFYEKTEDRYTSSLKTLFRTIEACKAESLIPLTKKTISLLLPQNVEERNIYKQGFVWIGANPNQPGLAFYLEMAPYSQQQGWQIVENWLEQLLPDATNSKMILKNLSNYCKVASAGLEGSTIENTRAKIYFRLTKSINLADLGVSMLSSEEMNAFLTLAMGAFEVELDGLVMSIGFNLSTGSLEDCKVDLCGHCLRHTPQEWQSIVHQITNRFSLPPLNTDVILQKGDFGFAFIGMGLTTDLKPRLNLYIKHETKTGAVDNVEINSALKDAISYLQSIQDSDGSWEDYQLPVGASDQWITAYTGLALAQHGKRLNNSEAIQSAIKAANWLTENRTYTSGWGYNGRTGPDSDSTALVIALLDELDIEIASEDRLFLSDHWQKNSGIATYEGPEAWGLAHWDVTPWGFHGMLPDYQKLYKKEFITAMDDNFMPDGFWKSYWWRNPFYATWVTLEVLQRLGIPEPKQPLINISPPVTIENPFDLSCYIGIEYLRNPTDTRIENHLRQLLRWQSKNGRWAGSENLRVTDNTCYSPWEKPSGNYYEDLKGTITTATAIQVLSKMVAIPTSQTGLKQNNKYAQHSKQEILC